MAAISAADAIRNARRLVIKVGSALLVSAEGALRQDWLAGLVEDVALAKKAGKDIILVSSGAIALGRHALDLPSGALSLDQSQAAAAVGQIRLARAYEAELARHNLTAAQVLVTLEDSTDRRRYLNSRATIGTLLSLGAIPIVNENDTVATDEIRFGDNDRLAAQVAALAGSDALVLLSDIDGLYSSDPRLSSAEHIPHVPRVTAQTEAIAGDSHNPLAKGGMKTKVWAARTATAAGAAVVLTLGDRPRPLLAIEQGARATHFAATQTPALARKRWIDAMKPKGRITIDAGAVRALGSGKSLLPAGVTAIGGAFKRGDPVDILSQTGELIARGLSGYDAEEAQKIAGAHSRKIAEILGHEGRPALVHRDDMAL